MIRVVAVRAERDGHAVKCVGAARAALPLGLGCKIDQSLWSF